MSVRNIIFVCLKSVYSKLLLTIAVVIIYGCANSSGVGTVNVTTISEEVAGDIIKPAFSRYIIIQNSDSTYGFTVFVNSRPCLHIRRIPVERAKSGFFSRDDAEKVAEVFLKLIDNGVKSPVLTQRIIDSLKIDIRH